MPKSHQQELGAQKNKLLRYKDILEVYLDHKEYDVPDTVIWRKYIYPRFHISRRTLYTILSTPVERDLKEIKRIQNAQPELFD